MLDNNARKMLSDGNKLIRGDKTKRQLGILMSVIAVSQPASAIDDNTQYSWLKGFFLGKGEVKGVITLASDLHLNWPLKPSGKQNPLNIETYDERILKSTAELESLVHTLEALRYIIEVNLEDYEWESYLYDLISLICESFDDSISIPDESDRSIKLSELYKIKRGMI